MTRPQLTVRARLTLLYALLVGASTGVLLLASLWLIGRSFDRTLPEALAGDALREVALQYGLAFIGVLLLAAVIGWGVAGRVLAPLKRITATARRVSDESLAERIPVSGADDELRELGETLNSMLDRLEGSFESRQRFVANASHELRSPLTVIRAEAEVALANAEPDIDELRGMAEVVVDATRRTEALLAGLLILARSQPDLLRTRRVELDAAARCAVEDAEARATREGVRLSARLEAAEIDGRRRSARARGRQSDRERNSLQPPGGFRRSPYAGGSGLGRAPSREQRPAGRRHRRRAPDRALRAARPRGRRARRRTRAVDRQRRQPRPWRLALDRAPSGGRADRVGASA